MKKKAILLSSLVLALGCIFTSCDDSDTCMTCSPTDQIPRTAYILSNGATVYFGDPCTKNPVWCPESYSNWYVICDNGHYTDARSSVTNDRCVEFRDGRIALVNEFDLKKHPECKEDGEIINLGCAAHAEYYSGASLGSYIEYGVCTRLRNDATFYIITNSFVIDEPGIDLKLPDKKYAEEHGIGVWYERCKTGCDYLNPDKNTCANP